MLSHYVHKCTRTLAVLLCQLLHLLSDYVQVAFIFHVCSNLLSCYQIIKHIINACINIKLQEWYTNGKLIKPYYLQLMLCYPFQFISPLSKDLLTISWTQTSRLIAYRSERSRQKTISLRFLCSAAGWRRRVLRVRSGQWRRGVAWRLVSKAAFQSAVLRSPYGGCAAALRAVLRAHSTRAFYNLLYFCVTERRVLDAYCKNTVITRIWPVQVCSLDEARALAKDLDEDTVLALYNHWTAKRQRMVYWVFQNMGVATAICSSRFRSSTVA